MVNFNWITFCSVILLLPIVEIIALLNHLTVSMPVAEILAIEIIAVILVISQLYCLTLSDKLYLWKIAILWFLITMVFILYLTPLNFKISQFMSFFIPLSAITILATALFKFTGHYRRHLALFSAGFGLILSQAATACYLTLTIHDLPYVYDPVLYRFDALLGLGFVSLCGDLLRESETLHTIIFWIYTLPTIWIILGAVSEFTFSDSIQTRLTLQFLVSVLIGYPLYYTMPALAPAYFFAGLFPDHLPDVSSMTYHRVFAPVATFRNAMPSLHTTWLILTFLALKRSPVWHKLIGFMLLTGTILATLGFGEHYAVDLIAALPLVLLVRGVCAVFLPFTTAPRKDAILSGIILLGLWIFAIRNTPASLSYPFLIQILAVASIALPIWLERQLASAEASKCGLPTITTLQSGRLA